MKFAIRMERKNKEEMEDGHCDGHVHGVLDRHMDEDERLQQEFEDLKLMKRQKLDERRGHMTRIAVDNMRDYLKTKFKAI